MRRITEETDIIYTNDNDLSYTDTGGADVLLYVNNKCMGKIKVWLDSEMNEREYICINHTIVYLDMLKKNLVN